MRVFHLLILIIIISCQSRQDINRNSTKTIAEKTDNPAVPSFFHNFIRSNLPSWKITTKNNWEDLAWKNYKSDSSQINYVLADINCDGKVDFTGIMVDSTSKLTTFQIYSIGQDYSFRELEGHESKKLNIGLRFIKPLNPFKHPDGFIEKFKCGAIESFNLLNEEKKIYHTNEKGYFVIEIRDKGY